MRNHLPTFALLVQIILIVRGVTGQETRLNMTNAHLLYTSNFNDVVESPLEITNPLPQWLKGDILHNGFRAFESRNNKFDFLFDCFAGLHRLHIDGDTNHGTYTAALLKSDYFNEAAETGTIPQAITFGGTTPSTTLKVPTIAQNVVFGEGFLIDNLNVAVTKVDDLFFAISDINKMVQFDFDTLSYTRVHSWDDEFSGLFHLMSSAHPVPHPSKPGKINYVARLDMMVRPLRQKQHVYRFFHFANAAEGTKRELIGEIETDKLAYVHSFATTSNYIIFFEFPLYFKILPMVRAGGPLDKFLEWLPERGTKVTVMHIETGRIVQTFKLEAMFAYHHINAFEREDDSSIVVDLSAFEDAEHLRTFDLDILRSNPTNYFPASRVTRVVLPNIGSEEQGGTPTTTIIAPTTHLDLTSVNSVYFQKPYTFVYGVAQFTDGDMWNSLVKIDTQLEQQVSRWAEDDCYPAEPQFVPRPGATSEDDGVLLSIVLSGEYQQSFLLVLDAKSFEEQSRIWLPDRTTYLSHGLFLPS